MFNPTQVVIDAFVDEVKANYSRMYGLLEPEYPNILGFVARLALENIANSDAPYHDVNHTILVTAVGQEIARGRHLTEGRVSPHDWLHFVIALLCHDIGYVRGVCRGDGIAAYVTNDEGDVVQAPPGATDAFLTPYHVNRSRIFVRERFGDVRHLDASILEANIEYTRFPVPDADDYKNTDDYPALVRAADLIGQLGDISYLRKIANLYYEFQETGTNEALGFHSPADLRRAYPRFFWQMVSPYIGDALGYLRVTQEGKQWIAMLYAHVFEEEHGAPSLGAERLS